VLGEADGLELTADDGESEGLSDGEPERELEGSGATEDGISDEKGVELEDGISDEKGVELGSGVTDEEGAVGEIDAGPLGDATGGIVDGSVGVEETGADDEAMVIVVQSPVLYPKCRYPSLLHCLASNTLPATVRTKLPWESVEKISVIPSEGTLPTLTK